MYKTNCEVKQTKKFLVLYKVDVEMVRDEATGEEDAVEKETPLAIITNPEEEEELRLNERELSREGYRLKRDWFENEEQARHLLGLVVDLVNLVKKIIEKIRAKRAVKKAARKKR